MKNDNGGHTSKRIFRIIKRRQIQIALWENQLSIEGDIALKEYEALVMQIRIVISAMEILTDEKRFIVETHLINHKSWSETARLYEEKWGMRNGRSERSLKRKQSEAIKELIEFVEISKMEKFFPIREELLDEL